MQWMRYVQQQVGIDHAVASPSCRQQVNAETNRGVGISQAWGWVVGAGGIMAAGVAMLSRVLGNG